MQLFYIKKMHRLNSVPYGCNTKATTKKTMVFNEGILPRNFLHEHEIDSVG